MTTVLRIKLARKYQLPYVGATWNKNIDGELKLVQNYAGIGSYNYRESPVFSRPCLLHCNPNSSSLPRLIGPNGGRGSPSPEQR